VKTDPERARGDAGSSPLPHCGRMDQAEFHRRYQSYPPHQKVDLVDGEIYVAPPRSVCHGALHCDVSYLLHLYKLATPGVAVVGHCSTILDERSEVQPYLSVLLKEEYGGTSHANWEDYICGPAELLVQFTDELGCREMQARRAVFERAGVGEFLAVSVAERQVNWFHFPTGSLIEPNRRGVSKSRVFPGLWLAFHLIWAEDYPAQLALLDRGLASPEHAAFVKRLAKARERLARQREEEP
jgi:hypothetical protein